MERESYTVNAVVIEPKTKNLSLSVTIDCVGCGEVFYGAPTQVWKAWTEHLVHCDLGLEELKWSILRKAVLKRDDYTCQDCGHRWLQGMHVHHRIFRSQGGEDEKANLITLCRRCHQNRHHYKGAAIKRERR